MCYCNCLLWLLLCILQFLPREPARRAHTVCVEPSRRRRAVLVWCEQDIFSRLCQLCVDRNQHVKAERVEAQQLRHEVGTIQVKHHILPLWSHRQFVGVDQLQSHAQFTTTKGINNDHKRNVPPCAASAHVQRFPLPNSQLCSRTATWY